MKYYIDFFKRAFDFQSRTSRRGYWMFFLVDFGVRILLGIIGALAHPLAFIYIVYAVLLIVPTLSLTARRLHDVGYTGWLQAAPLPVVLLGVILAKTTESSLLVTIDVAAILLVTLYLLYLTCKKGDPQPNEYGETPALA